MVRRKRIDIFFILYLTAILGFVIVSKERDKNDELMQKQNERIIRTFLPQVPLHFESDTVRWYVSADSAGIVTDHSAMFHDKVYVSDISADDRIVVRMHSVLRNGIWTTQEIVNVGERTAFGPPENRMVYFPVSAMFPRTGTYTVNLTARASRVTETTPGSFTYRSTTFDSTDVSREMIRTLEHAATTLTVQVIDTSVTRVKTLETLRMDITRTDIQSAVGFEERNDIRVNLGWSEPDVSIVRGFGRLERTGGGGREQVISWRGIVRNSPDTIMIEARLNRDAGGKDIVRKSFAVSGITPILRSVLPHQLYAGEDLNLDISVDGLEEPAGYSWELFEDAGSNDLISKGTGRGPDVRFRIPNSYGGKNLIIEAQYNGRRYRYLSARTHSAGSSRFQLMVVNPPTQIQVDLPDRASVKQSFKFWASRYIDPRFRGEQPIEKLSDVRVEIFDEEDNLIRTDISMIRKGEFTFLIQDKDLIRREGEHVIVIVHAGDATLQSTMHLYHKKN